MLTYEEHFRFSTSGGYKYLGYTFDKRLILMTYDGNSTIVNLISKDGSLTKIFTTDTRVNFISASLSKGNEYIFLVKETIWNEMKCYISCIYNINDTRICYQEYHDVNFVSGHFVCANSDNIHHLFIFKKNRINFKELSLKKGNISLKDSNLSKEISSLNVLFYEFDLLKGIMEIFLEDTLLVYRYVPNMMKKEYSTGLGFKLSNHVDPSHIFYYKFADGEYIFIRQLFDEQYLKFQVNFDGEPLIHLFPEVESKLLSYFVLPMAVLVFIPDVFLCVIYISDNYLDVQKLDTKYACTKSGSHVKRIGLEDFYFDKDFSMFMTFSISFSTPNAREAHIDEREIKVIILIITEFQDNPTHFVDLIQTLSIKGKNYELLQYFIANFLTKFLEASTSRPDDKLGSLQSSHNTRNHSNTIQVGETPINSYILASMKEIKERKDVEEGLNMNIGVIYLFLQSELLLRKIEIPEISSEFLEWFNLFHESIVIDQLEAVMICDPSLSDAKYWRERMYNFI